MIALSQRIMEDTPFSSILQSFLARNHREDDFKMHDAVELYKQLLPESQRVHIKKVTFAHNKLIVETTNAGLRFELLNRRSEHMAKINADIGKNLITDIIFR